MDTGRAIAAACEMNNEAQLSVASYFVKYLYTLSSSQRDSAHEKVCSRDEVRSECGSSVRSI